jgi:hypothetical protein
MIFRYNDNLSETRVTNCVSLEDKKSATFVSVALMSFNDLFIQVQGRISFNSFRRRGEQLISLSYHN